MKESPLHEKSKQFAKRIVKLYCYLRDDKNEFVLSKQVVRSGTSIGANISESKNAQSTADFVSKLSIALKEADETQYWIGLLKHGNFISEYQFSSLNNDLKEIIAMLTSSIKTMKNHANINS